MTDYHHRQLRTVFGWVAMAGALAITILTGYRAHQNTIAVQNQIAHNQALIYASLESDRYPLCVIDSEGTIVVWNRGMVQLSGMDIEEAQLHGIEEMICEPDKKLRHEEGIARAFRRPVTHTVTIVNCTITNRKTREAIPVHISVRIHKIGDKLYAVARVDRQSQVKEYGTSLREAKGNTGR